VPADAHAVVAGAAGFADAVTAKPLAASLKKKVVSMWSKGCSAHNETDGMTVPEGQGVRRIFLYIERLSSWSRLRSIGNSAPARATIVIPLVGYLIIFNEQVLSYLTLSPEIFGKSVGISTKLLNIYFGLCFVAIASFLFAWFCPLQIRKYGAPVETGKE
jgi:hypothetical protein